MNGLRFTVYGDPIPQGSMKAFTPPGFHRPIVTSDNEKLKPWRQSAGWAAKVAMQKQGLTCAGRGVPMSVEVTFFFRKPKRHPNGSIYKTTLPDVDKLLRSLLDSMTGIVYTDDSQVAHSKLWKLYDSPARTEVQVIELVPADLAPPLFGPAIKDEDIPF